MWQARFFVGILDIFGFEIFETNSLEQLCINFTNEKLQATFNQAIFHAAMEENAEEDVNVEVADMTEIDNQEVIELIEATPNKATGGRGGILSILNEECVVPKGTYTQHSKPTRTQENSTAAEGTLPQPSTHHPSLPATLHSPPLPPSTLHTPPPPHRY